MPKKKVNDVNEEIKKITKKKKRKVYFGIEVQEAIIKYNSNPNDYTSRNRIYQEQIHAAFDKLAENIINTFKFTYFDYGFEDIKNEVVAFMVMNMHKYDHTKGSKAFSYFSVVAKNYLILHNNNNYKKLKMHDSIDDLKYHLGMSFKEESPLFDTFMEDLIKYFDYNLPTMFKKKSDIDIAHAVVELMRRRDEIENFNKKSLYLLIREMTGVNTSRITKIMNVLRSHYRKLVKQYDASGDITSNKSFF